MLIWSCDKNEQTPMENKSSEAKLKNDLEMDRVSVVDCGAPKCPSTWNNCSATCLFSSVCICWDPKVMEGECGCYFGIAKAVVHPIQKQSATAAEGATPIIYHYINTRVNTVRFSEYLNFLESQNIESQLLKAYFEKLLQYTISRDKEGNVLVDEHGYRIFAKEYESFLGALKIDKKDKILTYIKRKSIETGIH